MGKIIFYEDRDFGGRHYECSSDCADLHSLFDRCRSIRVEDGMFVVYDRPGFTGNQLFVRRGEYSDYMSMAGMNDCVRSCRMIPPYSGSFRLRLFEHFDMAGEVMELSDDCSNLMDRFRSSNFNSCTADGHWLLYEQPGHRGRHYYLRPGAYRSYSEWNAISSRVGSVRRLADL